MNKLSKILFLSLYVVVVLVLYLTSATLSKYVQNSRFNGEFAVEEGLYFEYTRGNLYLNDNLIQGLEIYDHEYDSLGNIIKTSKRLEFQNVSPSDKIQYTFYVSNLSESGIQYNGIDGYFVVTSFAKLNLPSLQNTSNISCNIAYRKISGVNASTVYTDFPNGSTSSLPVYDTDDPLETKYEFQLTIFVSDQAPSTDNDDYVDATLNIYIFVDATDND